MRRTRGAIVAALLASVSALIVLGTVLAVSMVDRWPPTGSSNQSANFSGTATDGWTCSVYWAYNQDVDIYAWSSQQWFDVYQLDWGGGYLSDDVEDTWWYLVAWIVGDGGSEQIDLGYTFLGSYPSKYDGGTYSYATNDAIYTSRILGNSGISTHAPGRPRGWCFGGRTDTHLIGSGRL